MGPSGCGTYASFPPLEAHSSASGIGRPCSEPPAPVDQPRPKMKKRSSPFSEPVPQPASCPQRVTSGQLTTGQGVQCVKTKPEPEVGSYPAGV